MTAPQNNGEKLLQENTKITTYIACPNCLRQASWKQN